jgi:hypothetical protein
MTMVILKTGVKKREAYNVKSTDRQMLREGQARSKAETK